MSKKFISYIGALFALIFIVATPLSLQAQIQIVDTKSIDKEGSTLTKYDTGNYDLDDMLQLFVTSSNWILGIVGSLTLIMFIYGGLLFLTSAGSSEQVSKAKGVLVAAIIGLVIVFSSYLIIKFALGSIGMDWDGGDKTTPATTNSGT